MPRPRFAKLDPERRHAILDAAKSEFAQNGYDGASYNRIIEAAGLSKGAMYYYFDDKLDVYVTVLEEVNAELVAHMGLGEGTATALDGDFWEALTVMSAKAWEFMVARPELAALAKPIASFPRKARHEGRLADLFSQWTALLTALLQQGQAQGQVRTDLPMGLLVEITLSLDETLDFWLFEHMDELQGGGDESEEVMQRILDIAIDLWRRLLTP